MAKGLWLRVLVCWALGSLLPFFDEADNYDLRFRLRGQQPASGNIVLIHMDQRDWTAIHGPTENWMRSLKEFAVPTDSFFWKASTWDQLLGRVLGQKPKSVGVTFFFSQQLPYPDARFENLFDPRIIWAGQLDSEGRTVMPLMANSYGYNVALTELREDEDRVVRRFAAPNGPLPHLALKLTDPEGTGDQSFVGETRLINFRGGSNSFRSISAADVLRGRVPPEFFKNKVVIIGSSSLPSHQFQTPTGRMSRAEILAQVADNTMANRWISRSGAVACSLYILAVLLLAVLILRSYPQAMAFVFLLWLGLGTTAFSLWIFDSLYLWVPAFSPLLVLLVAYIILIGYQLAVKENQTWRLEQEKQLLSELDQLRNNFVSLISHDLKTPIAKIQAICDRLLAGTVADEVRDGLGNVRKESVELHRYIQSILQLSKLESNSVQLRKEATDLNEVVGKVVEQISSLASDKRQDLHVDLEPMFSIEVDSIMIQEVVLNLVENAIKYTPNDGQIEVKTQEVDDRVIFTVKDSGPGIPSKDREHIFEKFFRGQAEQSQVKGTGLGLFLVKYFVELHGGEVFLESDLGKGTRVGFTLPLQA
jgi:signal transduction histidine kinase